MFGLTETEIGLGFTACTNWNRSKQRESTAVLILMATQNKEIFRAGPCFKQSLVVKFMHESKPCCYSVNCETINEKEGKPLLCQQSIIRKGNHSFANSPLKGRDTIPLLTFHHKERKPLLC